MIKTGIESRVKIQDIISNQVPTFVLNESPKFIDFLKTYYSSQEYQGGPVDLSENLDQYLKLDNLKPEVIVDSTTLSNSITESDTTINVSSTKGFPESYGLLKIDDEIITYSGITTNSFIGCTRGFSGITNFHDEINKEELVFNKSTATSHNSNQLIENLSSLFLKEFFDKTKYTFANNFQKLNLFENLNVGNFIKEVVSFYRSRGTDDSIKILLKILFGKNGKSINLEDYLLKSSDASFIRREVIITEAISGDISKLSGQTIQKVTDPNQTKAVVSEIEPFTRNGTLYYKMFLYVGFDDSNTVQGNFEITPSTKSLDKVLAGSSVITVDSTVGFKEEGIILSGDNTISYTEKSFNQFLSCSGITTSINKSDNVTSNELYSGYENGDLSKECIFRITGVINGISSESKNSNLIEEDQILYTKNLGDYIQNPLPKDKSYKQIFANSWIYNTSTTVDIESFDPIIKLKTSVDKSQFKVGDRIEIIDRSSKEVVYPKLDGDIPFISSVLQDSDGRIRSFILTNFEYTPETEKLYSIRRIINKAYSKNVPIKYGNYNIISDIQNVYTEGENYAYVASNSLPSSEISESAIYSMPEVDGVVPPIPFNVDIDQNIYRYYLDGNTVNPLQDVDEQTLQSSGVQEYTTIKFPEKVKFLTGDRVYYSSEGSEPLVGLTTGSYYVRVLDDKQRVKLYTSRSHISKNTSAIKLRFSPGQIGIVGEHIFTLYAHRSNQITPKQIFKKFNLQQKLNSGTKEKTNTGQTGILVNGVEISNYKTTEKVYYGPIETVSILNYGKDYDVINLPEINAPTSTGIGVSAKIQPVISGEIKEIVVDSNTTKFDISKILSINVTGGNGKGGVFDPVFVKKRTEMLFDARPFSEGGGISTNTPQITFVDDHNLTNGQEIVYRNETRFGNVNIDADNNGIADSNSTLINNASYFVKVDNNRTVKLYETFNDYKNNTNVINFGKDGTYGGIQKFVLKDEINSLSEIKIIDPGNFTNRKLIVNPTGINTSNNTINFNNHNFNTGELIDYDYDRATGIGISISSSQDLSTDKKYFVLKVDNNSFRICDAGIGGTSVDNFNKKKYVKFHNSGSGYQYFKYPDIKATVEFITSVGVGSTTQSREIELTPVIKGPFVDAYLYESGTQYGSTIINFEKQPEIEVIEGKNAQIDPIISSGLLIDTNIPFSGYDYFSPPDLSLYDPTGSGTGAKLRAVTENGQITKVIIQYPGRGYSNSSRIIIKNSGSGVIFNSTIRSLDVNNVNKIPEYQYQILSENTKSDGLNYSVSGYYTQLRTAFNDIGNSNSGIIGWAYDGNPIYGSYSASDPKVLNSELKRIESSYELDTSNVIDRPPLSDFPAGFFVQDYVFTGNGDLDEHNGRFGKTIDFPNGVYAYFATINSSGDPQFPYFIGDSYRLNTLKENIGLDQNFDLNNSSLLRNTFPYKISELNSNNDFIIETNEISRQKVQVTSVSKGSIDSLEVLYSGNNYNIGDKLLFDNKNTGGSGVEAEVSKIKGKEIESISENVDLYSQSTFIWNDPKSILVKTSTPHSLNSGDHVTISGVSTNSKILSLDHSFKKITVEDPINLKLEVSLESQPSIATTEIYVSDISEKLRIDDTLTVANENGETNLIVLNTFPNRNIIRVERSNPSQIYSVGSALTSKKYNFTIEEKLPYFDSSLSEKIYFNPTESVGVGTTSGDSISVTFDFGLDTISRSIPMGRIYLENHKFNTNDVVTFKTNGAANINIVDTYNVTGTLTDGDEYYIVNTSPNTIGIKTSLSGDPVYFTNSGANSDKYSFETSPEKELADIRKITATVSISTSHGLVDYDKINLSVEPNLSVGIGTSTSVSVILNQNSTIGINTVDSAAIQQPITNDPTRPWVFTTSPQKHNFKNGDKVVYSRTDENILRYGLGSLGDGLFNPGDTTDPEMQNVAFYVRVVNDTDFMVSETYDDVFKEPIAGKTSLAISGQHVGAVLTGTYGHIWTLVNPQIKVVKGNDLVFDLSDTSLSGKRFKIFYDKEFNNEFVSIGNSTTFNISGVGTVGLSTNASLTIQYSENLPKKLYYNFQDSSNFGILSADNEAINYNEISYVDSEYGGTYECVGIGSTTDTTFDIALKKLPERSSYLKAECTKLEYTTSSQTAFGPVDEVSVTNGGQNYKKLPSISSIDSKSGIGFYGRPSSETIGKIKDIEILTTGFEYSSDKTLTPSAFISPKIDIRNSNILSNIEVLSGGKNYTTTPSPIVVDSITRKELDGGLIKLNIIAQSIESAVIENTPYGISADAELFVKNNTNGISILKVESSNSGIFTCTLKTPILGFEDTEKLNVEDLVFIEGIQKEGDFGDGFNSSDLGFRFFRITEYDNSGNNDKITIDASEYTTNTGLAKTIQDSSGTVVNKKNYPTFDVSTQFSPFASGEDLLVNGNLVDLKIISHTNQSDLTLIGSHQLLVGDRLQGKSSGNIAFISKIQEPNAKYNIGFSNKTSLGWKYDTGKLSEDHQVLPDNDYYQTLSYSVKSPLTWEEIKSSVNSIVHISGMKNFADTEILSEFDYKTGITTAFSNVDIFLDLVGEKRVDTTYNFDEVRDIDVVGDTSKFLEFKNSVFIPYTKAKTNVVLTVDDISPEFSQFESEPLTYKDILETSQRRDYRNYTFKITDIENTQVQLTKLSIVTHPNGDSYIHEQESLVNSGIGTFHDIDETYGDFELVRTPFEETVLRFAPKDPYTKDYDIKYLEKRFGDSVLGIDTSSIGFVDLVSIVTGVTTGVGIVTVMDVDPNDYDSIVADVFLNTMITDKLNVVRLFVTHDGTDTNLASYSFDSSQYPRSSEPIGIFTSRFDPDSGNLKIEYENTEEFETVVLRARAISFGSDASASTEDEYHFNLENQPEGQERSLLYRSDFVEHTNVNTSDPSIGIFDEDSRLIDAIQSVIEVRVSGAADPTYNGSALYEVSFIQDTNNSYTQEGPAIYATEDTSGIGTFGAEVVGNRFYIDFYPNDRVNQGTIKIKALSECYYTEVDTINDAPALIYGSLIEKLRTSQYLALEGERINKKNFTLRNEGIPIFAKTFDPTSAQFDPVTGQFNIPNHFFSNNEKLIYTPKSTFIGVNSESIQYATNTDLPTTVYARVDDFEFDTFRISLNDDPNSTTDYLQNFTSTGSGNAHQFAMDTSLTKAIISLDGMIQSPIAFTNISHSLENNINSQVIQQAKTFALSGIQTVNVSDVLKINDEFMIVRSVGLGTTSIGPITGIGTTSLVTVERGVLGTTPQDHSDGDIVGVYKGSYNMVGEEIYFIDAPKGNSSIERTENNLRFQTSQFSGRAFLRQNYDTNKIYDNVSNEFNGIGRTFSLTVEGQSQTGIGTSGGNGIVLINGIYQTPSADNNPNNNFEIIEDGPDSSVEFTGYRDINGVVGYSITDVNSNQLPRGGLIVSIGSSGGLGYAPLVGAEIDLITDYHHDASTGIDNGKIQEVAGKFVTETSFDVTLSSLTNTINGISTSNIVGITTGMELLNSDQIYYLTKIDDYYEDVNDASKWTIQLNKNPVGVQPSDGLFNVSFGYRKPLGGSGYFNNPTVTIVDSLNNPSGVTANITATVGAGGTVIFNIAPGDEGNGHVDYPQAFVSEPSYSNLEVTGVSRVGFGTTTDTGIGLLIDIEVGAASTTGIGSTTSEVKGFKIKRPGYAFRKGDKFTPVGLVTAIGLDSPIDSLVFEVLETHSDDFASWQFGELDFIDSIKSYQNGVRTKFPLLYKGELFSVQVAEESRMNIENALLIFINGVLQNPGENYFFSGGSSFTLSEPAKVDDQIAVFFYRGTKNVDDEQISSVIPTIEKGDAVTVEEFGDLVGQEERKVFDYTQSDILETAPYNGKGIYTDNNLDVFRPVTWNKQKRDLILNGDYIFKTRRSILSQVYPTTNIIKDINSTDTVISVENIDIFSYENASSFDWNFIIIEDNSEFSPASFNVGISGSGITASIADGGSGYSSETGTIELIVEEPPSTIRSGWPKSVHDEREALGGAPSINENENPKYYALPPQKSTSGIITATISNGTLNSLDVTPGSGYVTAPTVVAPLPKSITNISPLAQSMQGFSGIITHISLGASSGGNIISFHTQAEFADGWDLQLPLHTGSATCPATGVSPAGGTGAQVQVFYASGVVTEVRLSNRGSGYSENDVITIDTSSVLTSNVAYIVVDKVTGSSDIKEVTFKLKENYLNEFRNAVNNSDFDVNSELQIGDYISISNTNLDPVGIITTLDTDMTSVAYGTTPSTLPVVSTAGSYVNAIYRVDDLSNYTSTGVVTSYVHTNSTFNPVGIALTTDSVGNFSWGRITLTSSVGTGYTVSGNTTDLDLSQYPTIQRRNAGLRGIGALIERRPQQ